MVRKWLSAFSLTLAALCVAGTAYALPPVFGDIVRQESLPNRLEVEVEVTQAGVPGIPSVLWYHTDGYQGGYQCNPIEGTPRFLCYMQSGVSGEQQFRITATNEFGTNEIFLQGQHNNSPRLLDGSATPGPRASVTLNGTAEDVDGDLAYVEYRVVTYNQGIEYDWQNWVRAEGTTNYTIALQNLAGNTNYSVILRAWDATGLRDLSCPFGDCSLSFQISCNNYTATNSQHVSAGRAYTQVTGTWFSQVTRYYAVGSNEELGTSAYTTTALAASPADYFYKGSCPTQDTTAPVITLQGNNPLTVPVGTAFVEPGFSAIDANYGNVTSRVTVSGDVNVSQQGTYTLVYTAVDPMGNLATATRTVNVAAVPACVEYSATNAQHETAGRAYTQSTSSWWTTTKTWYAVGSNTNLGTSGTTVRVLNEQPGGSGIFNLGQCPAAPQPPVITHYEISSLTNAQAIVTGTATDPNNNINNVVLVLGAVTGVNCTGTTSFTCVLNFADYGIEANGNPIPVSVAVFDTTDLMTVSDVFQITRPALSAPTINTWNVVVSGTNVTVSGTASDPDGDLAGINIDFGPAWISCQGTTQFVCQLQNLGAPGATFNLSLRAYDQSGLETVYYNIATVTLESAPTCVTATNAAHGTAGRATLMYNVLYYANGSNDYLGLGTASSSLQQTAPNSWKKVTFCP